jgi:hypothetical protein
MNKLNMFLFSLLIAIPVLARDANLMKYVSVLDPVVSTNSTSAAIDVAAYKGNGTIVVDWGISTEATYTGVVTVAHSATSGGTYTTITNLAGTAAVLTETGVGTNQLSTYPVDLGAIRRYIKATVVQENQTNAVGVILVAPMKSE